MPLNAPHDRRQRRLLVLLSLLFFAPLGAAFILYYGHIAWRPVGHVNRGDLINPAIPLPPITLPLVSTGAGAAAPPAAASVVAPAAAPVYLPAKWTLLYYGAGACDERCRIHLYDTRQVRIALDRDMDRVRRVFIADGDCCDLTFMREQHPDLVILRATPAAASVLALLPTYRGVSPAVADRVYVIDPLGNLMMSYADDAKPKGMLEDLKRLLRLSSVG